MKGPCSTLPPHCLFHSVIQIFLQFFFRIWIGFDGESKGLFICFQIIFIISCIRRRKQVWGNGRFQMDLYILIGRKVHFYIVGIIIHVVSNHPSLFTDLNNIRPVGGPFNMPETLFFIF